MKKIIVEAADTPIQTIRFAPVRRDSSNGNLYVLSSEFNFSQEGVQHILNSFNEVENHLANWHKANPVERIGKFVLIEVPSDTPALFYPV